MGISLLTLALMTPPHKTCRAMCSVRTRLQQLHVVRYISGLLPLCYTCWSSPMNDMPLCRKWVSWNYNCSQWVARLLVTGIATKCRCTVAVLGTRYGATQAADVITRRLTGACRSNISVVCCIFQIMDDVEFPLLVRNWQDVCWSIWPKFPFLSMRT